MSKLTLIIESQVLGSSGMIAVFDHLLMQMKLVVYTEKSLHSYIVVILHIFHEEQLVVSW